MWRFVLSENIRRYQALIAAAPSQGEVDKLEELIAQSQSELDELEEASTPELAREDEALKLFVERVTNDALKLHSAQFSTLQIYDARREHMIILGQKNFRAPFLHELARVRPGDGSTCGRCLSSNAPAALDDINREDKSKVHREAAREAGFRAVHAAPVRNRSGALIAVLSTYFSAPQHFSAEDSEHLEGFAASIGLTLERFLAFQRADPA